MKTKSIILSLLFSATALVGLVNCSGDKKHNTAADHESHNDHASGEEASAPQFQVDEKFKYQLTAVFSAYLELKESFIESDVNQISSAAAATEEALEDVDMKLVTGAAHHDWMTYLTPMQNALREIQATDELDAKRKSFRTLSDNLYKSVKAYGLDNKEAFYQYCPMAFDNEGAYWLSGEEKVRNPYFGDKMLTCGEVTEKLR